MKKTRATVIKGQSEFATTSYAAIPVPDLGVTISSPTKVLEVQCIVGNENCKMCFLVINGEYHRQELTQVEIHHNRKVYKGLGFKVTMDELTDSVQHLMVYCGKGEYSKDRLLKVEAL